jgi:hypothetical protein
LHRASAAFPQRLWTPGERNGKRAVGQHACVSTSARKRSKIDLVQLLRLRRVWVLAFAVLGLFLPWPAHADSRAVPPPPLFRLFLNDGHVVTTYGEYARVDRQVVASVPVGVAATGSDVPLETITLSADIVDWPRSEAYAAAVDAA